MAVFAIPQVDAFVIALVLALILWASHTLFSDLITGLARSVPVIGPWIVGASLWVDTWILSQAGAWIQWGITPFGNAIGGTIVTVNAWIDRLFVTLSTIAAAIANSAAGALSTAIQHTIDAIGTEIAQVQSTFGAAVAAVEQRAYAFAQALVADALNTISGIEHVLTAEIVSVQNNVQGLLAQQAVNVESELASAVATAERAAQSIEAGLDARLQQTVVSIDGMVQSAVARAEHAAAGVSAEIATAIPRVEGEIAHVSADQAATAALAAATAATLAKEIEECVTPLCDALHGQLPAFADVQTLLTGGLIIAAIIEAATHPDAAAHATHDLLGGTVGALSSALAGIR